MYQTDYVVYNEHGDRLKYGEKNGTAYGSSTIPDIYKEEKKSVINGVEKNDGYDTSQQDNIVVNASASSYVSSLQPYETYYYVPYSEMSELLDSIRKNILLPNEDSTNYWIATRCIFNEPDWCAFGMQWMENGSKTGGGCFASTNWAWSTHTFPIFPVVTVNVDMLESIGSNSYRVK